MDFGALPPEINSARIYTGAGSGSILVAAEVWDGVAVELHTAASSFQSVIWGLMVGPWLGPSAGLMVVAASPYLAWMRVTATQAELTANQARAVVGAFELAHAMTVPPAVVAENRAQLLILIATNLFGQNTPAIAVTEAEYGEMWAQDAAAMYGYASSAALATETLTPFDEAPEIATDGGLAEQAAVVEEVTDTAAANQLMSNVPRALQQLSTPTQQSAGNVQSAQSVQASAASGTKSLWATISPHLSPISNIVSMVNNHVSMLNSEVSMTNTMSSLMKGFAPAASKAAETVAETGARAMTSMGAMGSGVGSSGLSSGVSAGLGRAASVGGLSVPKVWAAANQTVTPAARALPLAPLESAVKGGPGQMLGGLPMGPMGNAGGGNGVSGVLRVTPRAYVMPRTPAAG
ncbi:PPE family protein [Mycobacterium simiae]|uniref:PPE family protein n=1 Tax=Mycobacterium simiae TaxID=1784 RepID=A0A5B1BMC7_MYCSI|nr:PPE family protein [Mycobacterium simiae]KAA1249231.1 PPE family protein [Mycobacterium simiae]